ncbi:uncharacterized protein CCOS01_09020 [Colletotrichum costaricense]|uniref:Uncharacterized protein n=1 Tax=Colletotrichum costaricense TaxID=1209916 RepID=A0AAJ0DZC8_9PEZI|nr:uncharacterized protein CCOS01_09020 [Colletotrichum costaricense]KAK1523933.1 hypothetical protein CCOS01_09020 [Colletotrichum costaricense]
MIGEGKAGRRLGLMVLSSMIPGSSQLPPQLDIQASGEWAHRRGRPVLSPLLLCLILAFPGNAAAGALRTNETGAGPAEEESHRNRTTLVGACHCGCRTALGVAGDCVILALMCSRRKLEWRPSSEWGFYGLAKCACVAQAFFWFGFLGPWSYPFLGPPPWTAGIKAISLFPSIIILSSQHLRIRDYR